MNNLDMKNLTAKLTEETKELKAAYIEKTAEWAKQEILRLKKFVADYNSLLIEHRANRKNISLLNQITELEKKVDRLPACVINKSGKVEKYIDLQIKQAEKHYNNSIERLAVRILKKGLNVDSLKLDTRFMDPNIRTEITDGNTTVSAYTIIAGGRVQKPHYRYLVK